MASAEFIGGQIPAQCQSSRPVFAFGYDAASYDCSMDQRCLANLSSVSAPSPDGRVSNRFDKTPVRHTYASMRTTMNLAPDVRELLRRESAQRGLTMTDLMDKAVRMAYSRQRRRARRRLIRENGYLIVAALPGERPITDARVREVLQDMEW